SRKPGPSFRCTAMAAPMTRFEHSFAQADGSRMNRVSNAMRPGCVRPASLARRGPKAPLHLCLFAPLREIRVLLRATRRYGAGAVTEGAVTAASVLPIDAAMRALQLTLLVTAIGCTSEPRPHPDWTYPS